MRTVWLTGALPGEPDPNTRYLIRDPVDVERCREFVTTPTGRVLVQPDGPVAFGQLAADYNLNSNTNWQKLFDWSTNGEVRVETGRYIFECMYRMTSMSATSGNAGFGIAGSATIGTIMRQVFGHDGSNTTPRATSGTLQITAETEDDIVTANTSAVLNAHHRGAFLVTTAGTIRPQIKMTTAAAAAVVTAGSWFALWRVGSVESNTVGEWT